MKDNAYVAAKWVAAATLALWAQVPQAVVGLLIFMAMDMFTGILAAYVQRTLSSEVSFRGLAKKVMILVLVAMSHLVEQLLGLDLKQVGLNVELESVVAVGYTINEGISIVENCARSGVAVPPQLVEVLKRFQKFKPALGPPSGSPEEKKDNPQ